MTRIRIHATRRAGSGSFAHTGGFLRILHIITRINQGGTARWLDVLVDEQRRAGHEVLILSGRVQDSEAEDDLAAVLPVVYVPALGRVPSPAKDAAALDSLVRLVGRLRPSLVNTHTSKAGALGRLANASLGAKRATLVHTMHGHLLSGFAGAVGTAAIRTAERGLGLLSDGLICVGPTAYSGVVAARIGRGRPIGMILPGARQLILPTRSAARGFLGLREDEFVVGWLGRLTRQKNPQRALNTAVILPDTRWIVAGDGDLMEEMRRNAPPNVRLPGWMDAAWVLAAADVYVHTADWEGFPYSVIEALQAGLRVVATDAVPPVPGVLRIDPTPPGVEVRLAEAIQGVRAAGPESDEIRWRRADIFQPRAFFEAHEALYSAAAERRFRSTR